MITNDERLHMFRSSMIKNAQIIIILISPKKQFNICFIVLGFKYAVHPFSTKGNIFCSIERIWKATNFEGILNHLHENFSPNLLDRRVFKWPLLSKVKYFRPTLSLNGLFRQRSSGYWRTRVSPPGITVTSTFRRRRRLFTWSVRWPRKKSHTRRNFSFGGLHGKHWQIHLPCPSVLSSGTKPS